jgi:hypothetical protein
MKCPGAARLAACLLLNNINEEEMPSCNAAENRTWDLVAVQDQEERNKLSKMNVPCAEHVCSLRTSTAMVLASTGVSKENHMEESRTELDSHANMPVADMNAHSMSDTGRIADVNPFTPEHNSVMTSVVDAAVRCCDCPCDGQMSIFVSRNALLLPSMRINLMPPFVMREAGTRANDTPKIQTIEPTEEDHSMYFPETDFRIPPSSWGMFSYFVTSKPTANQMMEAEDVCILTEQNESSLQRMHHKQGEHA